IHTFHLKIRARYYRCGKNVWAHFNKGEIRENAFYWIDRWQELIEFFTRNSHGLKLATPHLLVRAVLDEIGFSKSSRQSTGFITLSANSHASRHPRRICR